MGGENALTSGIRAVSAHLQGAGVFFQRCPIAKHEDMNVVLSL